MKAKFLWIAYGSFALSSCSGVPTELSRDQCPQVSILGSLSKKQLPDGTILSLNDVQVVRCMRVGNEVTVHLDLHTSAIRSTETSKPFFKVPYFIAAMKDKHTAVKKSHFTLDLPSKENRIFYEGVERAHITYPSPVEGTSDTASNPIYVGLE